MAGTDEDNGIPPKGANAPYKTDRKVYAPGRPGHCGRARYTVSTKPASEDEKKEHRLSQGVQDGPSKSGVRRSLSWVRENPAGRRLAAAFLLLGALAAPLSAVAQTPVPSAAPQLTNEEVQAKLAAQKKRLEELEAMVRAAQAATAPPDGADGDAKPVSEADVKKIVGDYLKENPGANLSNGVQTGYENGKGFVIRSTPDPKWDNWDDACKIPFELRIHGRIQADYYYYKVVNRTNHLTNTPGNGGNNESPDFSQLEIKRGRIFIDGTAFDPNLRYRIDLEANTRGLPGTAGGALPAPTARPPSAASPAATPIPPWTTAPGCKAPSSPMTSIRAAPRRAAARTARTGRTSTSRP